MMKHKICLVTGANSGIGYVTALELAQQGARVGMVCRNLERAEKARQEIIAKTNNEQIDIFLCDFAEQKQITQLAQQVGEQYEKIDILINNAGLIGNQRELTPDGLELTFAVNHLGYFMLTNLLKDTLLKSPEGRIINVSSEAHRFTKLDLHNLQLEKGYNSLKAYAISKLCNILFTKELSKRLKGTNLVTNCLHPGAVATNFANSANGFIKFFFKFSKPIFLSPEQGAKTVLYLATEDEAAQYSGEYWEKCKIKKPSLDALNEHYMTRLWEISTELTSLQSKTF
jgi:NAD(P)-dependent dehydrogenase (short-subunit alcohol dehydrogenase family)